MFVMKHIKCICTVYECMLNKFFTISGNGRGRLGVKIRKLKTKSYRKDQGKEAGRDNCDPGQFCPTCDLDRQLATIVRGHNCPGHNCPRTGKKILITLY